MRSLFVLFYLLSLVVVAFSKGGEGETEGGGGGVVTGDFAVVFEGDTYNPVSGKTFEKKDVALTKNIIVRGVHVIFTINYKALSVVDYTLTGAASSDRMVTSPTVVFASKVPTLTAAQLASVRLTQLQVKDDTFTAIFQTSLGKMKFQAKDAASGGIFQQEPEFTSSVELVHTLGDSVFYFKNSFTGKINFGNGVNASTTPAATAHAMLLGKDSPQVATKTFQSSKVSKWTVTSGGRMGGVLGEDAIELSLGATSCTSQCQAQNRIQGSLVVPPDPVNPTPL